jgi:periplasmic protein TonB
MDDLNEIVFRKKNKDYGTYVLRRRYNWHVCIGLFFSILIVVSTSLYAYVKNLNLLNENLDEELQQEMVEYEQYAMMKNVDSLMVKEPPIKKKVIKPENKTLVVVDTIKPEVDTIRVVKLPDTPKDSLNNDSTAYSDTARAGSANGTENGNLYTRVDQLPEFPGGQKALALFLQQNTHYPAEARKNKITGSVQIEFVVTKNGDIANVAVKKGVNILLDEEAMRVVKSFPKWKPARRKGYPIDCVFVLPFKFL